MKKYVLNKIKIAKLKNSDSIIAGVNSKVALTDLKNTCKTDACFSVDHLICTNTSIQGEGGTRPKP